MITYLLILEEIAKDDHLSPHLFTRRWLTTYLSRNRWSPLPTYLGGDGNRSTYFGVVHLPIYLPTHLGGDGHPPTYLGGGGHLFPLI